VSDDEVVFFSARRGEGQCVGVVGLQAECSVGCGCFAAAMEECEHGGAGVDGVGFQLRVLCEESSEEAAVSVAEDECTLLLEESGEVVEAAVFEGSSQGEVFEPAIWAGDWVEADLRGFDWRHGDCAGWL